MRHLNGLPTFSPILSKLVASLARENVSFAEVAGLIEKDTVLAGNVLRAVNSALYARRATVSSVRHAVSLMGIVKLRNTAMTLTVANLWNRVPAPAGWSSARFNLHSAAVAILADLLAQNLEVEYPEGAFAAGLLHDIGLFLIAVALPDEFEDLRSQCQAGGRTVDEIERGLLGFGHKELSAEVLQRWNLPLPMVQAISWPASGQPCGPPWPLGVLVRASDQAVEGLGISVLERTPAQPDALEEALGQLMPGEQASELLQQLHEELLMVREFFV